MNSKQNTMLFLKREQRKKPLRLKQLPLQKLPNLNSRKRKLIELLKKPSELKMKRRQLQRPKLKELSVKRKRLKPPLPLKQLDLPSN